MAINKVVYGNNTLIDLTSDTIAADKLLDGYTAHDKTGALITGTLPNPSSPKTITVNVLNDWSSSPRRQTIHANTVDGMAYTETSTTLESGNRTFTMTGNLLMLSYTLYTGTYIGNSIPVNGCTLIGRLINGTTWETSGDNTGTTGYDFYRIDNDTATINIDRVRY